MTAIAINPMIVSVSPIAESTPIARFAPTEHGGGVKKVVAVVAAIAIPIAAPVIASSIGLSAAIGAATTATIGSVVGSAIVGAGLGAVSAAVTGQSVKTGAIMGAIGGGISGYFNAPTQAAQSATPATNAQGASVQGAGGTQSLTGAGGADTLTTATTTTTPTGTELLTDGGSTLVDATTSAAPTVDLGAQLSNVTPSQAALAADTASAVTAPVAGAQTVGNTTMTTVGANAGQAAASRGFMETVKATGSAVMAKVTNPETLANMTLQAGAMLAANAMVPDPEMPPEERELLEMRKAELQQLKERDEAAFNQQMDAAKAFLQQAETYDPTYMAFQAGNKAAIENERKMREQLRRAGLRTGRDVSQAELRRMSLDASRDVSSKFDAGFAQGARMQDAALARASQIPQGSAAYYNALTGIQQTMSTDRANQLAQRDKEVGRLTKFFGGLAAYEGNTPDEDRRLAEIGRAYETGRTAGLNTSGIAS